MARGRVSRIGIGDWGLGIEDSVFGIRHSGFGIRDSGFEIWVLGFKIWDSGLGMQNSGFANDVEPEEPVGEKASRKVPEFVSPEPEFLRFGF